MGKTKIFSICSKIFLVVGIMFLIVSVFLYIKTNNFINNGEETTGTIVSLTKEGKKGNEVYNVTVEYIIDNIKYNNELNYYDSRMYEGQTISIRFLSNNPNKIMYGDNEFNLFWIIFGCGIGVSLLGSIFLFLLKNERKKFDLIKQENITSF